MPLLTCHWTDGKKVCSHSQYTVEMQYLSRRIFSEVFLMVSWRKQCSNLSKNYSQQSCFKECNLQIKLKIHITTSLNQTKNLKSH